MQVDDAYICPLSGIVMRGSFAARRNVTAAAGILKSTRSGSQGSRDMGLMLCNTNPQ